MGNESSPLLTARRGRCNGWWNDQALPDVADNNRGSIPAEAKAALQRSAAGVSKRISEVAGVANQPCRVSSRSEEHTSELQSLMRSSYAVFCWKKKHNSKKQTSYQTG